MSISHRGPSPAGTLLFQDALKKIVLREDLRATLKKKKQMGLIPRGLCNQFAEKTRVTCASESVHLSLPGSVWPSSSSSFVSSSFNTCCSKIRETLCSVTGHEGGARLPRQLAPVQPRFSTSFFPSFGCTGCSTYSHSSSDVVCIQRSPVVLFMISCETWTTKVSNMCEEELCGSQNRVCAAVLESVLHAVFWTRSEPLRMIGQIY